MDNARELPLVLRAAYFAMHRVSDGHFSRQGVTADQFVLLAYLAEDDGITQQELARRDCERIQLLLADGAVPQQQLDTARTHAAAAGRQEHAAPRLRPRLPEDIR